MKPTIDTQDIRWQTDDMNEWVMEEASPPARPALEPEVLAIHATSDAYLDTMELKNSVEGEETISEMLVNAGNEEAGLEQRVSADRAEIAIAEA